jgi:polyhydroxybutyrate depolymerase
MIRRIESAFVAAAIGGAFAIAVGACGSDPSTTTTRPGLGAGANDGADGGSSSGGGGGGGGGGSDASVSPRSDGGTASDGGVATATCSGLEAQPLDATWTLTSGGMVRAFNVHVPVKYDRTLATPLVLNFHGYSSNGAEENILALMSQKSDKEGFIAVHPEGVANSWNAGACCGTASQSGVDDVGFVKAMLDMLEQKLCIDTHRVFVTGMSNGGFMSNRLGCELADRIAAIAPVAGVLGMPTCTPSRPMPVIHFHGTADNLVPYTGNATQGFPDVPADFEAWALRDGCSATAVETYRKADSHCSSYASCNGGASVTLCTVDGGGHTWPGGTPVPSLGYTTTNLSATDMMWSFFQQHPLP